MSDILDAIIPDPSATPDPVSEPEQVDAPDTPAEVVETPQEAAERVYAGKYTSVEALEQGYIEAQRLISQRQPAEPVEDDVEAPYAIPFLGAPSSMEELFDFATQNPEGAYRWAYDNQAALGPEGGQILQNLYRHYVQNAPEAGIQAAVEAAVEARMASLRPELAYSAQQLQMAGVAQATQQHPDLPKYQAQIAAYFSDNQDMFRPVAQGGWFDDKNQAHIARALTTAYRQVKFDEHQAAAAAAAAEQAAVAQQGATPARSTTQTRSRGAAKPSGDLAASVYESLGIN